MEQRFGVAVGLADPLEHQGAGCAIGEARIRIAVHRLVERIARILRVDLRRHPRERRIDIGGGRDPVQQPVRHMLRRDAQRRTILHQADVMDVRNLGAADPLIDPAHDIAEDALCVVVQFVAHLVGSPVAARLGDRNGEQLGERCKRFGAPRALAGEDVDAMIMCRVQRRSGRRGDPGGVGAGLRMADLLVEHVGHAGGRRPHPLADLRLARQAAGETDLHVAVLISGDPGARLHLALRDHRAGMHCGVHLVAGAVEETGVDEDQPVAHGMDARGEVGAGAPLLVHQPELDRVPRQREQVLDRVEQAVGEGGLGRAVHLRLDDVDRAAAAVAATVVQRNKRGDDGVEDAFGRIAAVGQANCGRGHQMADGADEQQAAARQRQRAAVGRGIDAVGGERAGHRPPVLDEAGGEVAAHQPEPIGICRDLVVGIDRGDRVFQVADRGERAFQPHVGDAGGVGGADRVGAVDRHFDVQAVVAEEQAIAGATDQLRRVGKRGRAAGPVGPATTRERNDVVEEALRPGDDLRPARRVIAAGRRRAGKRVGAVERVVQASPARVGGVEQEAGVEDRDDQLRTGHGRDLRIDAGRVDREGGGLGDQISNVGQERLVGGGVEGMGLMPGVDCRLEPVAFGQQRPVLRREAGEERGDAGPEGGRGKAGSGQGLLLDEGDELGGDGEAGTVHNFSILSQRR